MAFEKFFHKKSDTKTRAYRSIALSFFGISLIVALVVFVISFSWATITIVPEVTTFPVSSRIAVQVNGPADDALRGAFVQRDLEGAGTFTPSATETKSSRISGVMTVVNRTGRAQPLRATTRFLSANNILFRSEQFVNVPAGGSADVPVAADKDGDVGTLDTSRFIIPGLWEPLQTDIYGASFTQRTGSEQTVRTVTQGDIDRAEREVKKKLEEKFSLLLDAEKPSFNASSVRAAYRTDVLKHTTSHAVGDAIDEFTLRISVRFSGVLLDERELTDRLSATVRTQVSAGYDIVPLRPEQIEVAVDSLDAQARRATLRVTAQGSKLRSDDIRSYHTRDLVGLPKDAIVEYFRGYDDIKDVQVYFSPFWVTRAPLLVDHIKIIVDKSSR